MNRTILGVPGVLLFFILVLLIPLLVADYYLYQGIKVVETQTAPVVSPTPEATPSATLAPTITTAPTKSTVKVITPTVTSNK